MDYFLKKPDFYKVYSETRFNELIEDDNSIWRDELPNAIEEISGYLRARYDVSTIFKALKEFTTDKTFDLNDRIVWIGTDYSESSTYSVGDYAVYEGIIYKCKIEVNPAETFDAAKWDEIADNYSIFVCIQASPGGIYPDDPLYFSEGDDRNPKIVSITVDIVLYNLLQRLNNIDIAINRKERYDGNDASQNGGAIGWLKNVARGLIAPDLPLRVVEEDDQTINKIIYGDASDIKKQNSVF